MSEGELEQQIVKALESTLMHYGGETTIEQYAEAAMRVMKPYIASREAEARVDEVQIALSNYIPGEKKYYGDPVEVLNDRLAQLQTKPLCPPPS